VEPEKINVIADPQAVGQALEVASQRAVAQDCCPDVGVARS
jgi:hypothetical protein